MRMLAAGILAAITMASLGCSRSPASLGGVKGPSGSGVATGPHDVSASRAATPDSVSGTYVHYDKSPVVEGMRERLVLHPDSRFEYSLAFGLNDYGGAAGTYELTPDTVRLCPDAIDPPHLKIIQMYELLECNGDVLLVPLALRDAVRRALEQGRDPWCLHLLKEDVMNQRSKAGDGSQHGP